MPKIKKVLKKTSFPPFVVGDYNDNSINNSSSSGTGGGSRSKRNNKNRRRRYERFIRDVRAESSSFGANPNLLFYNVNKSLKIWPGGIDYREILTICFRFCSYVLRTRKIPTTLHPPTVVDNFPDFDDFLRQKNTTPSCIRLEIINSGRFFGIYNSRPHLLRPALVSFCALLQTFQKRVPVRGDDLFGMNNAFQHFRLGDTIDNPVIVEDENENEEDEEDKLRFSEEEL